MIQKTSRQPRISPLAGQPAPKEMLIDIALVEREYHARKPDMDDPNRQERSPNQKFGDGAGFSQGQHQKADAWNADLRALRTDAGYLAARFEIPCRYRVVELVDLGRAGPQAVGGVAFSARDAVDCADYGGGRS